MTIVRCP